MQDPEVPETALRTFEQLHRLRITVHDLRGSLWPFLKPDRFQHSLPICQAVKNLGRDPWCRNFEVRDLRREINRWADGRVHICHAGLVEWVVPAFQGVELEWVLFAGVRTAGATLRPDFHTAPQALPEAFLAQSDRPEPVEDVEARLVLEHLRQVAARLWQWREAGSTDVPRPVFEHRDPLAQRRTVIHRFIVQRHRESVRLADLARELGLSESRVSHAVREACGSTFQQLVAQARVRSAMGLLRHSDLSVLEVALRVGFEDARQLQRAFQAEVGLTPRAYRKGARS